MKKKTLSKLGKVLIAATVVSAGVFLHRGAQKWKGPKYGTEEPGLIWSDEETKRYAGVARYFHGGAEQNTYIDKAPFGSLDGVQTIVYTETGNSYGLEERKPYSGDIETFLILEKYAKQEHPARFADKR